MTYTSRTDQPWWSDPEYTDTGERIVDREPVPYWPLDWVFATVDALNKRDAMLAERDAVMAASPLTGGCRE